jgi:hypothetical protein
MTVIIARQNPAAALFAPALALTMPERPLEPNPHSGHIDAGDGERRC